jgi:nicotinate dehydrogenase subunit A
MAKLLLKVNGKPQSVEVESDTPLLYVLRNSLELKGPRFGCGIAQCGACTVIINGNAVRSCVIPASSVQGQNIVTLEGLGTSARPHPIQKAFVQEQAAQCGYCMNGMIMTAKAFLETNPKPKVEEIKQALDPVICRCGSHARVIRAVKRAAQSMQKRSSKS